MIEVGIRIKDSCCIPYINHAGYRAGVIFGVHNALDADFSRESGFYEAECYFTLSFKTIAFPLLSL